MRTIAFINQKGGSGKSTLAACLAVAAREAGERVFVIDTDPQQSLLKWGKTRADDELPVEPMSAANLASALATLAAGQVTLTIIDTPAANTPAADAAIAGADLCIIPSRPTIFDIWSSEIARGKIKTLRKDYAFLLNQCPAMRESKRVQDSTIALEAMGGLLRPLIASRVDYEEAARKGLGVTEIDPHGKAAEEMRLLWASVDRRLDRVTGVAMTLASADANKFMEDEVIDAQPEPAFGSRAHVFAAPYEGL